MRRVTAARKDATDSRFAFGTCKIEILATDRGLTADDVRNRLAVHEEIGTRRSRAITSVRSKSFCKTVAFIRGYP